MNIVITGASSGLGAALYNRFGLPGNCVVGSSIEPGGPMRLVHLDLASPGSIKLFTSDVVQRLPGRRVDILINNAGINAIRPFEELTGAFIQSIMNVNFIGPVLITQEFLPYFNKGAGVFNIISDAAWRPMRHSLAYNCSKAALDMATKQMARELTKPYDISIVGIRPGKMAGTGMSNYIDQKVQETRGWTKEEADEYFKTNSVTGREIDPINIARMILNIVQSGLYRNMSGACVDLVG
jgi:NAD(P)-dependent dehydrogenase (short-subunit alcohol dehydrogenase family)